MDKEWSFDSDTVRRLADFMTVIAPSMSETPIAAVLRKSWNDKNTEVTTDVMGNVHAVINPLAPVHIGLVAHMDSVAIQITKILGSGLLQFRSIGLRPHTLLGQSLKLIGKNGIIPCVVGFDPTSQFGQPKGLIEEDLWLDIGASDYDDAVSRVSVGDMAVLEPRFEIMGDKFISGTAIDDRIGIFAITECLKWFRNENPNVCLHLIGTVQEELGLRGAATVAAKCPLNACFVLDVDYATDTLTSHDNQIGALLLGKGAGFHVKADNNPVLRSLATSVADNNGIMYQISVGRFLCGGTDASSLQLQNSGIATLNINIPCRYMHSPIEMCHMDDVESCIRLLICLIKHISITGQSSFIPGIDNQQ